MMKEEVRAHSFTHKKVRVSKQNTYKTFSYAATYLKMHSTLQKPHRIKNGQQRVCEIRQILLLFLLLKKPSSPSTKTPTTPSFLLAISFSYSDNTIKAIQYLICKTVNYCVKQKENNIMFNMTVFCDGEETDRFEVPNE